MALTVDQFYRRLMSSRVISADELRDWIVAMPVDKRPSDGEQMARELVRQKRLTAWQAQAIYQGKGTSLVLGNYLILDKVGQGGMGMVHKARHIRMGRIVALKVMSPAALMSADSVKRFHREVRAAAKLTHPNIVMAFDADEANGTHFLVMEFVEGLDLSAFVKKHGPLPVDQAVECIIQAARGLEFAHRQGVIHRDIKPANLLVCASAIERTDGAVLSEGETLRVKILDMGLARIEGAVGGSSEGAGLTQSGTIMGTVDYMSPEQAMDTKQADARSDIYSLGCSLYYLLTGKVVYDGDTMMKKLMAHQNAPIPLLAESLVALNHIFRCMVAKRPMDRPQTMTQVIAELECCLAGSPTISLAPSALSSNTATCDLSGGSSHELHEFLRRIGGEANRAAIRLAPLEPPFEPKETPVLPATSAGATMLTSAGEVGTDPHTDQSLTIEQSDRLRLGRTSMKSAASKAQRTRTAILVLVVAAVIVPLAFLISAYGKFGTLHLEITDDGTQVTIGDTGGVVTGPANQNVRLPLGRHVLHVKTENLSLDTEAIEVKKGIPVSITVERIGRSLRVRQSTRVLASKESPKPIPDVVALDSDLRPASVWRPTPDQQAFFDAVAKQPFDEQVESVSQKLTDVNTGFKGKLTPKIEGSRVVGLTVVEVAKLWPVRALPHLKTLACGGKGKGSSSLTDLSPLAGMPLTSLSIVSTSVSDLAPLAGMPLTSLNCSSTEVRDLSPLVGMPLTSLNCSSTEVTDLLPLARMPLTTLTFNKTDVSDLTPLSRLRLSVLDCSRTRISDLSPLVKMPLTSLTCSDLGVSNLSPLKGMPLTQLSAQRTEVRDLSPLAGMPLTILELEFTRVTDLGPLATTRLQQVNCANTRVTDLSPLAGLPLTNLLCHNTPIVDLSPLAGMPLSKLGIERTSVSDLALLTRIPLANLSISVPLFHGPDEKLLHSLEGTSFNVRNRSKTPEMFWMEYTARQEEAESFAKATAKLSPDEQVKALTRQFRELNDIQPVGFKPTVARDAIIEVTLTLTDTADDITPLRALTDLKKLTIVGGPHWLDLSPLNSTPLESLTCRELIARRNAHVLKSMPNLAKIDTQSVR